MIIKYFYICPDIFKADRIFLPDLTDTEILTAENTGSSFSSSIYRELSLSGLRAPAAVDYDPDTEYVYWTDEAAATISRAALDGSYQETVLSNLGCKYSDVCMFCFLYLAKLISYEILKIIQKPQTLCRVL